LDRAKRIIITPLRTQIDKGIRSGKAFNLYKKLDTTVKITAYMPVKRIKDAKTIAYLVSYTQSDRIFKILKNFNIQIVVLSVLLILFYLGFCKFLSQKHKMEIELKYDGLTNVYNRKHFMSMIEKEFVLLKSSDVNFSLVMADIDFFKKVNDTYGHQCGDTILMEFTTILKDSVRSLDKVARYGGEEFIIFLQTDENNAFKIVEKIREKIEVYEFSEKKLRVTASFGIAGYKNDISVESIIARADKALYKAKESGRNQTQIL
jgi:diguanylate cyclase (GGDEF)-like protein